MDAGAWAEELRRALPAELTKLRQPRGLSKNELSTRTGLARSFITTLEQGVAAPSVETLGRIAFVLGISPGEILKRAEKRVGSFASIHKKSQSPSFGIVTKPAALVESDRFHAWVFKLELDRAAWCRLRLRGTARSGCEDAA